MKLLRQNKLLSAFVLYLFSYATIIYMKPSFLFNRDGTLRDFGINGTQKTVISGWVLSIFLAFMSYIIVIYSTKMPKFQL